MTPAYYNYYCPRRYLPLWEQYPAHCNTFAPLSLLPRRQCEGKGVYVDTRLDRIRTNVLSAGAVAMIRVVWFLSGTPPVLPAVLPVASSTCTVFWILAGWPGVVL